MLELADEDLQRTIQLSLKEVEVANLNGRRSRLLHSLNHPRIQRGRLRNHPLLTILLGLDADDEEGDPDLRAAIEACLREANAPKANAEASAESPVVETSGQSYTSSSYTAPARTCCQCSSKL